MSKVESQNTTTQAKQLKKSDFLAVIGIAAMTRADIVDALADYTFIPTYLDYLTDHFAAQGKIVINEDGTVNLKGKKTGAGSRDVYKVEQDDEGNFQLAHRTLAKGEYATKDSGWSVTKNSAVKKMSSLIFAAYKEDTAAVKLLLVSEEEDKASAEQSE